MKLLSIKAHGFKSFADKIEINLTGGITGIVGPNGSGKSNIVDAVKWVLGEQSIKNLRGQEHMTDVIFSGSKSRRNMTRAWVSLTFDNTDHYLKSDFDILEIKRVVYSTGENEYYINNTKVRLKDITELFIDSGSSTNSFSIISQGKISEILSGKVSDRRSIIEEAAGVLKYKKHKEETLRKIDKANDNIEKVDLVIKELVTQLEPLKQEKDDAIKYKRLKSEHDELDIILTGIDLKTSEEVVKNLKNDMLVLFILDLIIFFFSLINKANFFSLVYAMILFIGYNEAKKGNKNAGIIGIIIGILMMLTILFADILDFLLGLFVLMHSVKYIEIIDKNH